MNVVKCGHRLRVVDPETADDSAVKPGATPNQSWHAIVRGMNAATLSARNVARALLCLRYPEFCPSGGAMTMISDQILSGYLRDFQTQQGLESANEPELFSKFALFCVICTDWQPQVAR